MRNMLHAESQENVLHRCYIELTLKRYTGFGLIDLSKYCLRLQLLKDAVVS